MVNPAAGIRNVKIKRRVANRFSITANIKKTITLPECDGFLRVLADPASGGE